MSVEWTAESYVIEANEGSTINSTFSCVTEPESGHRVRLTVLSSSLPASVSYETIYDGIEIKGFRVYTDEEIELPQIKETTTYFITARLEEYSGETVYYYSDKCIRLIILNTETVWKNPSDEIVFRENTMSSVPLSNYMSGLNDDEVFKKTNGTLPPSVTLSSNGILSGTPTQAELGNSYEFYVGVYRNNELILDQHKITITIEEEDKHIPPVWVTESGIIASLSAGDVLNGVKMSATMSIDNDDSVQEKTIRYTLVSGNLPSGLSYTTNSNQIVVNGILTTSEVGSWNLTFDAARWRDDTHEWYPNDYSNTRTFIIKTNLPTPDHVIDWEGDKQIIDAGSYSVGTLINTSLPKATAADGEPVYYEVVDAGTFPQSIEIGINGTLTGTAELPTGIYTCSVKAYTSVTYITKTVRIRITKGLGKSALNLSLNINLEYKDEYKELLTQLNPTAKYGTSMDEYAVNNFPKIDIATLSCFDRELLAGIFNYGNPEIVRFLETKYKTYSDEDVNGDAVETYEAYYKVVDEGTYQWYDENIGNFDFDKELESEIDQTEQFGSKITTEPDFYPMESDAVFEFNKEKYNSFATQKQWTKLDEYNYQIRERELKTKRDIDGENVEDNVTYDVFNIELVREQLQKKIYAYKLNGDYYFDLGSQKLFEKDGIRVKKLYETEVRDPQTYEMVKEYHICNTDGTNDEIVKYIITNLKNYDVNLKRYYKLEGHEIYNSDNKLITNTLFVPEFNTHQFMIDEDTRNIYYLEDITDPWCLNREKTTWISLDKLQDTDTMVLPRITDDDIESDDEGNSYFVMLDTKVEPLPKWKRKSAIYWTASTTYNVGDILYYDSKYYLVIKKFTSDYGFEYDANNIKLLSNDEVKQQLSKQYFPTLDLGYYKSGRNRIYLEELNKAEKQGKYWYKKEFLFWEVTCEPVYDITIDTFGVPFVPMYNTMEDDVKVLDLDGLPDSSHGAYPKLTINPIPGDAIVTLTANGYAQDGNSIVVDSGTTVDITVSADGYITYTDSIVVTEDITLDVSLRYYVTLTIDPTPDDSTITLIAHGYTQEGNSITVLNGTEVRWEVSKNGYKTEFDSLYVNSTTLLPVTLLKMVTATVIPEPNTGEATITITAPGYIQQGNSITVPEGTTINITVTCPGFFDEEVSKTVTETGNIIIVLESNIVIYNLLDEENNSLISEQDDALTSEVYIITRE